MIKQFLTPDQASRKNSLALAYVGDSVYDIYFRTRAVCDSDARIAVINKDMCAKVNAASQAKAAVAIEQMLSAEEADVFKRARNAKVNTVPKNMSRADYHAATALEAVIGYNYLIGDTARVIEIMDVIAENEVWK